jgi:hypothetical protein
MVVVVGVALLEGRLPQSARQSQPLPRQSPSGEEEGSLCAHQMIHWDSGVVRVLLLRLD